MSPNASRQEAREWLRIRLGGRDPVAGAAVKADARRAGIATRTLARAAADLGVRLSSVGFPSHSEWSL